MPRVAWEILVIEWTGGWVDGWMGGWIALFVTHYSLLVTRYSLLVLPVLTAHGSGGSGEVSGCGFCGGYVEEGSCDFS